MAALGRHILTDFYGCDPAILDDEKAVERILLQAAGVCGATVVGVSLHRFAPQGVSGVVLIAESHIAIHTWPENRFAAIDIFTCGPIDHLLAYKFLLEAFGAQSGSIVEINRGIDGLV